MLSAIATEIRSRSAKEGQIETIYFGGGTPSLIDTKDIAMLLDTVLKHHPLSPEPEITLEANPDDVNMNKAREWKSMGINRFSIGTQSFDDIQLKWMNRAHDAQQSLECIEIIRETGFENFSIDLIYGTPGQNQLDWEKDLQMAITLKIPHLSCYAMTVEEGTALHSMIKTGTKQVPLDEEQALRFYALIQMTRQAGYHHYEISNFALEGKESRHNSSYWQGKPYLGFGPSAHSFDGKIRSWNPCNNMAYIQAMENGQSIDEKETLSHQDLYNEYVMTALRLSKGIDKYHISKNWGAVQLDRLAKEIRPFVNSGKIQQTDTGWVLTDEGKFFADGIAAALFTVG